MLLHGLFSLFSQMTTSAMYTKTRLLPFTKYSFRLIASNIAGSTISDWANIVTKQDSKSSKIETRQQFT